MYTTVRTGEHSSKLVYTDDGIFGNVIRVEPMEDTVSKTYNCPRGHTFKTNNPIVIAVDAVSYTHLTLPTILLV